MQRTWSMVVDNYTIIVNRHWRWSLPQVVWPCSARWQQPVPGACAFAICMHLHERVHVHSQRARLSAPFPDLTSIMTCDSVRSGSPV